LNLLSCDEHLCVEGLALCHRLLSTEAPNAPVIDWWKCRRHMYHLGVKRITTRGIFVAVALSSLGLAACGSSGGSSGNKALKLGTEFPVSGTDAAVTLPAQYGVDLAVQQNKDLGSG